MLQNESELFDEFIDRGDFCVAGFSLGAIRALEYVYKSSERVDKIQLFSPAFFQNKDQKFKRMQLMAFNSGFKLYKENFYKNSSYPSRVSLEKYYKADTSEVLEFLLEYEYDKDKIDLLLKRGVKIEVFLGERDRIIDFKEAKNFFGKFATIYQLKGRGHILHG